MKITFFDLNRLSFYGGAEKYFEEVGECLAKKGNQMYFVGDFRLILFFYIYLGVLFFINPLSKVKELLEELNRSPSIDTEYAKYFKTFKLSLLSLFPLSSQNNKIKLILEKSDVIFVKNEIFELIILWLLNIKRDNKQIIIFSSLKYPLANTIRSKFHNFLYSGFIFTRLIRKFKNVVVSNKNDEEVFIKNFRLDKSNVKLVPYGLKKSYFAKDSEIKICPDFNILFVGRMEEQKGIIYLNQILEYIYNSNLKRNIYFNIAGSGPLENIPILLAKKYKNVKYKGQVFQSDLRKYYLESDLVVITSKWETFSYVCLEAQSCGVPVIAFNISGPSEMIEEGITGKLIIPWDIKMFCSSIFEYYFLKEKKPKTYLEMRKNIVKKFKLKYSINKTAASLEDIVKKG